MADAVISTLLGRLEAHLGEWIWYEVRLVRGAKEEVRDLSNKLETIKDVLDDAEKRGVKDKSVKRWLKELDDKAYEMDDILDEWKYTLVKRNKEKENGNTVCCSFISSTRLCFKKLADRRTTSMKIHNVKVQLDRILKIKDDFQFIISQPLPTNQQTHSWRVPETSSIDPNTTYGRVEDKNNIVRLLMANADDDTPIPIVSIVGMGGLGKTTLARLVYNDTQVEQYFPLKIWVCVSDPFDVAVIAREIVQLVGTQTIPPDTVSLELILRKLRDSISGKKFLLVLDDVWEEHYHKWEQLKSVLAHGEPTSKILVTTRKKKVARMMHIVDTNMYHPQKLTREECWLILRHMSLSGKSEEECGEFEDVGKKIAIKCEGLPLAAKVLGSLLQMKKSLEEWGNILKSEIWQLKEAELDLFPHLVLSYNELSPDLKRCFSYCAVYPKDYRINAKDLIDEWMALGYLGRVSGSGGAERKGQDYINTLAMHSLFQDFRNRNKWGGGGDIEWCEMHDIVHDFAEFLRKNNEREEVGGVRERSCQVCNPALLSQAQEYRCLIWGKESPTSICDCVASVRVLSLGRRQWWVTNEDGGVGVPSGMEKLIHLRWLELSGNTLSKEDLIIICRLYLLQTLGLAKCGLEEIPSEIENLGELRHLDLSRNAGILELPDSMCSLVELKVLNIEGCSSLSRLPEEIHRLENLQHLLMDDITLVRNHLPEEVGQLTGLRSFGDTFYAGSGGNKLGLLKGLNRLTGNLKLKIRCNCISDLGELVEDARKAELRNKVHIQTLFLQFYNKMDETADRSSSMTMWMDVIEALEPHQKLKGVEIYWYPGSRLPHWISSPHNFVKKIQIFGLEELTSLPPMGKLPFLEYLFIAIAMKVKLVGREFLGIECWSSSSLTAPNDAVVAFPKLEILIFSELDEWAEWEDITAEEEESVAVSIMPCLTELKIYSCDNLKKLPHRLLRKVSSSLEFLHVVDSKELLKNYGDGLEIDDDWFDMPCRNNPQLDIL